MRGFLGSHQNKLDAKGRVSIPAPFRSLLKNETGEVSMVVRPHHQFDCLEVWPDAMFDRLSEPLEQMPLYGQEEADMAAAIFADAYPMEADKEGRIVLSPLLLAHANVKDTVVFMGLGRTFQIWEPEASVRRRAEARASAAAKNMTLPGKAA